LQGGGPTSTRVAVPEREEWLGPMKLQWPETPTEGLRGTLVGSKLSKAK